MIIVKAVFEGNIILGRDLRINFIGTDMKLLSFMVQMREERYRFIFGNKMIHTSEPASALKYRLAATKQFSTK